MYRELLRDQPGDNRLPIRLAEISLWAGEYDEALRGYLKLLQPNWNQKDLWPGYIDALASAKKFNMATNRRLVLRIYDQVRKSPPKQVLLLSRLAWVLRRVKEPAKSIVLLQQALRLDPESRVIRRHLAESLQAAGRNDEAEAHFAILLRTRERE